MPARTQLEPPKSNVTDIIARIPSEGRIFIHGGVATPLALVDELVEQAGRFKGAEIIHLHTSGEAKYADARYRENFRVINLFVGTNLRGRFDGDHVDYLPCFLSEIPGLFRRRIRAPQVSLIQVSPPDAQGYCSLGTSVDVVLAAIEVSDLVIAQINRHVPRVHGDGLIPVRKIHGWVHSDQPLPVSDIKKASAEEVAVAQHVASLVPDGATLQMGIGSIPDAVMASLTGHKNLGIHTEMFSDGVLPLIHSGVINNSCKKIHKGKTIAGFVVGSQALYDFVHDNPAVNLLDIAYVNDARVIARNPKVIAINSAVEVDLTGQVCADSIGSRIISGVGGQMDFIRGAAMSDGGLPIIALTSRSSAKSGSQPRIVSRLKSGAGVVTTRAHVHAVVTEYGVAQLAGKTLSERAMALIQIAHPMDREPLEREYRGLYTKKDR